MQKAYSRTICSVLFRIAVVIVIAIRSNAMAADGASPVARWSFGAEEPTRMTLHGAVKRDQPGPRPPEFPDFDPHNSAARFGGEGARFMVADPGPKSVFDFTNGDAITLEAWVDVEEIQNGEARYIIGKGRTGAAGFAHDNQNWALRVREIEGRICVNFLFASTPSVAPAKADSHWHRWTSTEGFGPGTGWHHIAVRYRFGAPESINGWIDGVPRAGVWDMGGATKTPPVNDDDAIWIASSQGGNSGSSFRGSLDEVQVHREFLSDGVLRARFHRTGPERVEPKIVETVPEIPDITPGSVVVTCHEGLTAHNRWWNTSEKVLPPASHYQTPHFLIPRLPRRYDNWGIRESWKPPVLVRAATDVALSAGRRRFVVRTRGLSRLWVNGQIVVRMKPHSGSSDGHEAVEPLPEPPLPGLRAREFGDQEAFGDIEIPAAGKYRVILEAFVGGKNLRPEPGEMLVAVQSPDAQTYHLLQSADNATGSLHLTDEGVAAARNSAERVLTALDDQTRRAAAQTQVHFWDRRHQVGSQWVQKHNRALSGIDPASTSENSTPVSSGNPPAEVTVTQHEGPAVAFRSESGTSLIDALITQKIDLARKASTEGKLVVAQRFYAEVFPILRDNCFRCHGEKEKGGLRLNHREGALQAGDSGAVALVPSKPAESELLRRVRATDSNDRMPPSGPGLTSLQIQTLEAWIQAGAEWPAPPVTESDLAQAPLLNDADFLRRVSLDTVGVPPAEAEFRRFMADSSPRKREAAIDQLLNDERYADHWVSYWQDVLAENPNTLKPSLNNSGPFRWFLYESLRDNKPFDRLVTELILLRGSEREGGSAGFGLAADNDAPFAAKGHIIAGAFLGIDLQCARCHDSPYHSTKQKDLFSLAAMLSRKPVTVPPTSTVSPGFFDQKKGRESLIQVTLKLGEPINPEWPFSNLTRDLDQQTLVTLLQHADDTRERLAALITAPHNERFSQVIVNRIWKRLMGAGFVEPAQDWEGHVASHPELLSRLAREFVAQGFDVKQLIKTILNSQTYQRAGVGRNLDAPPEKRFFAAPERRRMSAEQVVDSLFSVTGHEIEVEEITFDPEAKRPATSMISLGFPSRAWMFATLSNERDRPSLSLPRAQAVTDVLEAFGWSGSRQNPRTDRESDPTVLQPGVLANSTVVSWVTKASAESGLAQLAVDAHSPEELISSLYIRILGRLPTAMERSTYTEELTPGFDSRLMSPSDVRTPTPLPKLGRVSWSNHLNAEANRIKLEMERRSRIGSPPDPRLQSEWRERYEDLVWSMINSPEFLWLP